MIRLEHAVLPSPEQMEFVIEGMRNPHNSWDKSDSYTCDSIKCCSECREIDEDGKCGMYYTTSNNRYSIGPNDLSLMKKLSNGGPVHSKYMRMMTVMVRITAPLYWWKEFDTYKVGTVANSCSTMHKIHEKEFVLNDFSYEHMFNRTRKVLEINLAELNYWRKIFLNGGGKDVPEDTDIFDENIEWIELYLEPEAKEAWWQMIQLLGSNYNQTRNVMMDYEVLKNIYTWRHDHKVDDWVVLCKWIETLPHSEIITNQKDESKPEPKSLGEILLEKGLITEDDLVPWVQLYEVVERKEEK